jgi:hypothetical protein
MMLRIQSDKSRELSLEQMLTDPIVRALMAADGVDADEVKALVRLTQHSIARRTSTANLQNSAFPRRRCAQSLMNRSR